MWSLITVEVATSSQELGHTDMEKQSINDASYFEYLSWFHNLVVKSEGDCDVTDDNSESEEEIF